MQQQVTTFYILRHGETEWNVKKLVQGLSDSPLTENGLIKIHSVATELKKVKFDLAFSSDLLRAKRTAEIIALEHKLAVDVTQLLRERDFGIYEGKSFEALKAYDELFEKLSDQERFSYKGEERVENDESLVARLLTFLRETAMTHPGKNVLAVTHGSMIRAMLVHLGYLTYQDFWSVKIGNVSYFVLETDGVDFFVKETHGINRQNT